MEQALGWLATFLFTACFVPQMIRTWRSKTVDGLSFFFLLLQLLGNLVAIAYALMIGQSPLVAKYAMALGCLTVCLVLYGAVRRSNAPS